MAVIPGIDGKSTTMASCVFVIDIKFYFLLLCVFSFKSMLLWNWAFTVCIGPLVGFINFKFNEVKLFSKKKILNEIHYYFC